MPCHMLVASAGHSWMKTAPQASATPGAADRVQAASMGFALWEYSPHSLRTYMWA